MTAISYAQRGTVFSFAEAGAVGVQGKAFAVYGKDRANVPRQIGQFDIACEYDGVRARAGRALVFTRVSFGVADGIVKGAAVLEFNGGGVYAQRQGEQHKQR